MRAARSSRVRLKAGRTYFQTTRKTISRQTALQMMSYSAGRSGFSAAATMFTGVMFQSCSRSGADERGRDTDEGQGLDQSDTQGRVTAQGAGHRALTCGSLKVLSDDYARTDNAAACGLACTSR